MTRPRTSWLSPPQQGSVSQASQASHPGCKWLEKTIDTTTCLQFHLCKQPHIPSSADDDRKLNRAYLSTLVSDLARWGGRLDEYLSSAVISPPSLPSMHAATPPLSLPVFNLVLLFYCYEHETFECEHPQRSEQVRACVRAVLFARVHVCVCESDNKK